MKAASRSVALTLCPVLFAMAGCRGGSGDTSSGATKPVNEIPKAAVAAGQEGTLFPTTVGSQWTYAGEQTTVIDGRAPVRIEAEITRKVAKVTQTPRGEVSSLEVYQGTKLTNRLRFLKNSSGIFLLSLSLKDVPYSSPQPMINFPIKIGEKTHWKGHGYLPIGTIGDLDVTTKVTGVQEVDTDSGRVSAYAVQTATVFKLRGTNCVAVSVAWFRPGVGIVRDHQEIAVRGGGSTSTLRLKSSIVK